MQSPPPAEARTSRAIRLFPSSTRKTRRDHRHEPEHHDAAHGGDISHGFLKGGRTDGALSGGRLNITRNVRSKFCSRWPSPRQLEQLRRQVLRAEEFNSQFAGLQRYITREITHAPRSPRPAALLSVPNRWIPHPQPHDYRPMPCVDMSAAQRHAAQLGRWIAEHVQGEIFGTYSQACSIVEQPRRSGTVSYWRELH
jgi:hypothetical protein